MLNRRQFIAVLLAAAPGRARARAERIEYPQVAPRPLVFPRDHGAHPDYRIEWWYITGWLRTSRGEALGVQVTFFRARGQWRIDNPAALAPRQFIFAHAALADTTLGRLRHDQRGGRTGLGLAGADEATTRVWIDDWTLTLEDDRYVAAVAGKDFGYRLAFVANGAPLLHGDGGVSRKGTRATEASFYYSRPHLAVTGTIERDGRRDTVTGEAWLDHEWSSQYMASDAVGWDWCGLNLEGGGALMAFVMRAQDGSPRWAGGTLSGADGALRTFGPGEVTWEGTRRWRSPRTGTTYPVGVRLRLLDRRFELAPLMDDQELDSRASVGTIYWEGAVRASEGGRVAGRGYLELTGYWKPQRL